MPASASLDQPSPLVCVVLCCTTKARHLKGLGQLSEFTALWHAEAAARYEVALLAGLRRVAELGGLRLPPEPAAIDSWLPVVRDKPLRKAIEAHRDARAALALLLPAAGAAAGSASAASTGPKDKNEPRTQRVMAAAIFARFSADALVAAVDAGVDLGRERAAAAATTASTAASEAQEALAGEERAAEDAGRALQAATQAAAEADAALAAAAADEAAAQAAAAAAARVCLLYTSPSPRD